MSQSGDPDQQIRQADQFILCRAGHQIPDLESVTGRGRRQPVFRRTMTVVLWARLRLDELQRDLIGLTDPVLGHFVAEAKIWDALVMYQPQDASGNWLISQPIRPGPAREPIRGKAADPEAWLYSGVEFEVSYCLALPTPSSQNLG